MKHEHKYISGTIGDECSFCGLLKSTIETEPMTPKLNEEWEKEFDMVFGKLVSDKDNNLIRCTEGVKTFIRSVLASERQRLRKEIELAIAEEINIAHQEGQPTSRLTRLAMRILRNWIQF